jgi:hypothetical protein
VTSFNIVHHEGVIKVKIDEDGHAILDVDNINDDEVVVRAINRAFREGARTGTLFTNDVVNDHIARMHTKRSERGTTWLGGRVTRLPDLPWGPQFRIDWDEFPQITE